MVSWKRYLLGEIRHGGRGSATWVGGSVGEGLGARISDSGPSAGSPLRNPPWPQQKSLWSRCPGRKGPGWASQVRWTRRPPGAPAPGLPEHQIRGEGEGEGASLDRPFRLAVVAPRRKHAGDVPADEAGRGARCQYFIFNGVAGVGEDA